MHTNRQSNNFQWQFIKLALLFLPHHLLLWSACKLRWQWAIVNLNHIARSRIVGRTNLQSYSNVELDDYGIAIAATQFWHGTGRFQYGLDGEVVDVLESMLRSAGTRPRSDAYAIFSGGEIMSSTSLTRLRIIARCYADIHGLGWREPHRYGNALVMTAYHYGLFYARLYTQGYFAVRKYYAKWHSLTHDDAGKNTWGQKVHFQAQDVWDVFGLGSDIVGNYPILIGIRGISKTVPLSKYFRDYEVRVDRPIRFDEMTHLEVPQARLTEVKKLLEKFDCNLPVLAIECGELVASKCRFSQLLGLEIHN